MSTTTSINGVSYTSLDGGFTGATGSLVTGTYTALPPFGEPPMLASPETEEMLIAYFGLDGVGSKQGGFRGRNLSVDLIAASNTKGGAQAAIETIINGMPTNVRFDVTVPGGATVHGCKLKRGGGAVKKWFTIDTMICGLFTLELRQYSTTN